MNDPSNVPPRRPSPGHFGVALREARQAKGLTLETVYQKLKFRPNVIEALEDGDFTKLPEPIYARAFLKNYADYLGVDAQPLLLQYDKTTQFLPPARIVRPSEPARPALTEQEPWNVLKRKINVLPLLGVVLGVVLLGSAAAILFMRGGLAPFGGQSRAGTQASPQPTPSPQSEEVSAPAPNAGTVALSISSTPSGAAVFVDRFRVGQTPLDATPVSAGGSREIRLELVGYEPVTKLVDLDGPRNLAFALKKIQAPTTATPTGQVVLSTKGESWLRVIDTTGRIVYEKLTPAGKNLAFNPPIRVRAGNPSAVLVSIGGQSRGVLGPTASPITVRLP